MIRRADISPCRRYRYRLTRYWGPGLTLPFVMLNSLTPDAEVDDATIIRYIGFARREGGRDCGGQPLRVALAVSISLGKTADPIAPNDDALTGFAADACVNAMPIAYAWGARGGAAADRASQMLPDASTRLACLRKTREGFPRHSLCVRAGQRLEPFP